MRPSLEPKNFNRMVIKQKNTSKYFEPRVKLNTSGLNKVLFKLKKEKAKLDNSIEKLELISNIGDNMIKTTVAHTGIIRDLEMKANPSIADSRIRVNNFVIQEEESSYSGYYQTAYTLRFIDNSEPENKRMKNKARPKTAMTKFMGSCPSRQQSAKPVCKAKRKRRMSSNASTIDEVTSKEQMIEFYARAAERYVTQMKCRKIGLRR